MNKLLFIPIKEEFRPYKTQEFYCEFRLGIFNFSVVMFNVDEFKKELSDYNLNTHLLKKYCLMMAIKDKTWLFYVSDNYETTKTTYRECIDTLKGGDTYEFHDLFKYVKPIRINWQGIRFEW